ncbi:MAG: alpha/beta hydrolase [Clostridia bacterium]|nr:alpha/beta hydrolase [Clostridia bacterium]
MKLFKKILAVVLSAIIAFSVATVSFTASAKNDVVPVVFIPGIGQSETYMYDDEGNTVAHWNMIHFNADFGSYSLSDWVKVVKFLSSFILSIVAQRDLISKDTINGLLEVFFVAHLRDENGNFIKNVETPNYPCPISQYSEEARGIFDKRIPCQPLIDEIGEDNVYCYNYGIFSNCVDNARGLNDYIENVVLKQTGADKVILVPMSMGATVVNEYMNLYPDADRIDKVISVVGAWNGSDVFGDLLLGDYDEDAPSYLYTEAVNELGLGDSYIGSIINIAVRILPKAELRQLIDAILESFVKTLLVDNTAFIALCPKERYEAFADRYLSGEEYAELRAQTDDYAEAQKNLKERLYYQRDTYGTEFYFISGYNLGFGDCDYGFFKLFNSADETNSDEVIQISSTAPGTSFVKAGDTFDSAYIADSSHNVSPDGSIDASTCYFEDTTWYFEGQKHELTYNNTALSLAYRIACNEIKSVDDCKNTYPQFNGSRDIKKLERDYIPDAQAIDTSTIDAASAAKLEKSLNDGIAVINSTINDRDADDAKIKALYDTLVEINSVYNIYPDKYQVSTPNTATIIMNKVLGVASKVLLVIFGEKGYADYWDRFEPAD